MIIHKPQIVKENDEILVYAEITLDTPRRDIPKKLWYKFPKNQEGFISDRYDSFVVALLPIAMSIDEDIVINGSLSPKLKRGLEEYQDIFVIWFPEKFKKIKIKCKDLKKHATNGKFVVSCFTGGVDSLYTLYSCINDPNQDYKISHTLFIHGLEIDLKDKENYNIASMSHKDLMRKLGVTSLGASTNLLDFGQHIHDNRYGAYMNGTFLVSTALVLSNKMSKLYIPSSYDYSSLIRWSTHPMIDHLLSTESLEIIHHGASVKRIEKTEFISKIPETYSRLRVCGIGSVGLKNCCRCEKCLRTMITLEVQKKLYKYTTFPLKLTRESIRDFPVNHHSYPFLKETLIYVISLGRKDVAFDIRYAIVRSKLLDIFNVNKWQTCIWKKSAALKKNSQLYRNFVKLIKNT